MERSADKLTWNQEHFLNDLVQAKDFDTVMRERKITMILLLRWMTQTPFVEKWERCNRLLTLRRHTQTESAAICLAQAQRAQAGSPPPCNAAAPNPQQVPEESEPAPAAPPPPTPAPQISERDAIRARHGEEAACAFDRLMQLRKQREQSADRAAPTPTTQLAGAPPALSAVEVQVPSANAQEPRPGETPPTPPLPFSGVPEGPLTVVIAPQPEILS